MLLDAAGDPAVAVLVHRREVAGVEPAVAIDRRRGRVRHRVVAAHHEVAAGAELALRARAAPPGPSAGSTILHLDARQRAADRRDPDLERVLGARLRDDRRRLGLPVCDRDLAARASCFTTRRTTSAGHGAPPMMPVRSDERSTSAKRGCASSSTNIAGTP